jgi:thermostable 8-oxoguanine DNA glycosylase
MVRTKLELNTLNCFDQSDLRIISSLYLEDAIHLFNEKEEITKTNDGKWFELVYCILAGSQFPVKKLKPLFEQIKTTYTKKFSLQYFKSNLTPQLEIALILKNLGYRYHTQKSNVIVNTALYINTYYGSDISRMIKNKSAQELRNELTENIKGIGIKIASHWLRNIGYEICTIDIHLRRLLLSLKLSNDNLDKPLGKSDFLAYEKIFIEWSKLHNCKVGIVQYSIWEFVRKNNISLRDGKIIECIPHNK